MTFKVGAQVRVKESYLRVLPADFLYLRLQGMFIVATRQNRKGLIKICREKDGCFYLAKDKLELIK